MLFILGAVLVWVGGYWYLLNSDRVADLIGRWVTDYAGARVTIDSVHLGINGTVTLRGVGLDVPGEENPNLGRLIRAERVLINFDLWGLLRGRFRARKLTWVSPTLFVTEASTRGRYNVQHFITDHHDKGPWEQVPQLPSVFIRAGRVRFGEIAPSGQYRLMGTVHLEGDLTAVHGQPQTYAMAMRQVTRHGDRGSNAVVTGWVDLGRTAVDIVLEDYMFDVANRVMLPRKVRQWWDRLDPVGTLPAVHLHYDPDPEVGYLVELELRDTELTLPLEPSRTRMTHVSGRFSVRNDTVRIDGLTGRIEGLHYTISGRVDGFTAAAPLEMSLATEPFTLHGQPRYLPALPMEVQKPFSRFSPTGTFRVTMDLLRSAPGERLTYRGEVHVADAQVEYHKFHYPLHAVRGVIKFNQEQIEVVGVRGEGPTGARVLIHGVIAPPGEGAAVYMQVRVDDCPVDRKLYHALPPKIRRAMDLVMSPKAYRHHVEQGLLQTPAIGGRSDSLDAAGPIGPVAGATDGGVGGQPAGLSGVPTFGLGGRCALDIVVEREYGTNKKHRITTRIQPLGVNVLYEKWPYPLRVTGGRVLVRAGEVKLEDVHARSPTGAGVRLSGVITPLLDGRMRFASELDLALTDLVIDPLFLAAIRPDQAKWFRAVNLTGTVEATGRISGDGSEGGRDWRFEAGLTGGSLLPEGTRVRIDQLEGTATLAPGQVRVHGASGRYDRGRVSFSGIGRWGEGQPEYDAVSLSATSVRIDPKLLSLFSADDPGSRKWLQMYHTYQPEGLFDVQVLCRATGRRVTAYVLDLKPYQLSFDWRGLRVDLGDLSGHIKVTPKRIELDEWGGSLGTGRFVASGAVDLLPKFKANLELDVQAQRLDPAVREVLPAPVVAILDGLQLDGAYRFRGARVVYESQENAAPTVGFQGVVHLENASAAIGVPITRIDGDLRVEAAYRAGSPWPDLDLSFHAQHLLAADRLVSPLSLHLATDKTGDNPGRIELRALRGSCYGGTLLGSGWVQLGDRPLYQMSLALEDVALAPFIHPPSPQTPSEAGPVSTPRGDKPTTGVLAASLDIEASPTDPGTRRGRGQVKIRNASLYEVPLALAVMQLVNLSLPASKSFDQVWADFLFNGDLVRFDTIQVLAPTIEIVGSGTMRYSTLALDLDMVTRNPAGLRFGALSDLFMVFKDELLSIQVSGTLDRPEPKASSFRGIRKSWSEVFGGTKKPRQSDAAPVLSAPAPAPANPSQ